MLESDGSTEPISLDLLLSLTDVSAAKRSGDKNGLGNMPPQEQNEQDSFLARLFANNETTRTDEKVGADSSFADSSYESDWFSQLLLREESLPQEQLQSGRSASPYNLAAALGVAEYPSTQSEPAVIEKHHAPFDLGTLLGAEALDVERSDEAITASVSEPTNASFLEPTEHEEGVEPEIRSIRSKFADVPLSPPVLGPRSVPVPASTKTSESQPSPPSRQKTSAPTEQLAKSAQPVPPASKPEKKISVQKDQASKPLQAPLGVAHSEAARALTDAIRLKPRLMLPEKSSESFSRNPAKPLSASSAARADSPSSSEAKPLDEKVEAVVEQVAPPASSVPRFSDKKIVTTSTMLNHAPTCVNEPPKSSSASSTESRVKHDSSPQMPGGSPRRSLMFIAVALFAVAALAAGIAFALMAEGDRFDAITDFSTEGSIAAPLIAGKGSVEYLYKVRSSEGILCPVAEKAFFDARGILTESEIEVQLPDENQAQKFLQEASEAFQESLRKGEVQGSTARLTISAEGEAIDQRSYVELLRRSVISFGDE